MCKFLPVVVLLISSSLVFAEDRRTDPAHLIIMQLNAEFMWDGESPEEGTVDFEWKGNIDESEAHMRDVAAIIIRGNPDIVNLCEVENLKALTKLNDRFLAGRGYKPYLIDGRDTQTGQDVGVLTRIDPVNISRSEDSGTFGNVHKGLSKHYIADFAVGTLKFTMVGVHLLAFPTREDRVPQRNAQADLVRTLAVTAKTNGNDVIVIGDFNDYDGDSDALDHVNSTPTSVVLKTIRAMSPNDPADDLKNAASFISKALRYTAHHDANDNGMADAPAELTSIDHVLMSPKIMQVVQHVEIQHDHNPIDHPDHFAVVVTLNLSSINPSVAPGTGLVRIFSLLPNPSGDERKNEAATMVNTGTAAVNLTGWTLRNQAGQTWTLSGNLAPNEKAKFQRNMQSMAMRNNGATIDLVNEQGTVVHSVTYPRMDEDEEYKP